MFGNNIEKLGFYDSPWAIITVYDNGNGNQTIYKGRPSVKDAGPQDPVWFICKTTVTVSDDGKQFISNYQAQGFKNKWADHEKLNYQFV